MWKGSWDEAWRDLQEREGVVAGGMVNGRTWTREEWQDGDEYTETTKKGSKSGWDLREDVTEIGHLTLRSGHSARSYMRDLVVTDRVWSVLPLSLAHTRASARGRHLGLEFRYHVHLTSLRRTDDSWR